MSLFICVTGFCKTRPVVFKDIEECEKHYTESQNNNSGPKFQFEWAAEHHGQLVLAVVQAVKDRPDGSAKVSMEVEKNFAKLLAPKKVQVSWPRTLDQQELARPQVGNRILLNLACPVKEKSRSQVQHCELLENHCRVEASQENLDVLEKKMVF